MEIDVNGRQTIEVRKFGKGGLFLAAEDRDKGETVIVTLSKKQALQLMSALLNCVGMREALVIADSELSALAHGRPIGDKEEYTKVSQQLRKIYEGK